MCCPANGKKGLGLGWSFGFDTPASGTLQDHTGLPSLTHRGLLPDSAQTILNMLRMVHYPALNDHCFSYQKHPIPLGCGIFLSAPCMSYGFVWE